jgi:hypothetical protein
MFVTPIGSGRAVDPLKGQVIVRIAPSGSNYVWHMQHLEDIRAGAVLDL